MYFESAFFRGLGRLVVGFIFWIGWLTFVFKFQKLFYISDCVFLVFGIKGLM